MAADKTGVLGILHNCALRPNTKNIRLVLDVLYTHMNESGLMWVNIFCILLARMLINIFRSTVGVRVASISAE